MRIATKLRVARPTDHLEELVRFYTGRTFQDADRYRVVLYKGAWAVDVPQD